MSASILIVEDEAAIHQLLTTICKAEGFRTRIVETGEDVHAAISGRNARSGVVGLDAARAFWH